jgi:hypothetical protein
MSELTPVSKNAFVTMAVCEKTKKPYGITVDPIDRNRYRFVWAFKIDKDKAKREHFDKKSVRGEIENDDNYPGCPYCGRQGHFFCTCGAIVCNDSDYGYCPNCGWRGHLETGTVFNVSNGGGY